MHSCDANTTLPLRVLATRRQCGFLGKLYYSHVKTSHEISENKSSVLQWTNLRAVLPVNGDFIRRLPEFSEINVIDH